MAAPLGGKRTNSNMSVTYNLSQLTWSEGRTFFWSRSSGHPSNVPASVFAYASGHPNVRFCLCIWPHLFLPMYLATPVSVFCLVSGQLSICFCLCIWPPQYLYLPMHLATSVCFCQGIWSHQCVFAYVSGIFTWPHSWPCGVCRTCLSHTLSPQHHKT